jgi:hypothetical protein
MNRWADCDWSTIPPASQLDLVEPGVYQAQLESLEPYTASTGTPGIRLTFGIISGAYSGRQCNRIIWTTEKAFRFHWHDLAKIGIFDDVRFMGPIPLAAQRFVGELFFITVVIQWTGDRYVSVVTKFDSR